MKNNLKRFLCAAMVAVSSIFVGSVANAQPTQATVTIVADEEHPFTPEVGKNYILSVDGNNVNVTVTNVVSRDVSKPGNSDIFFASEKERLGMGQRRAGSVIRLRPNVIRTEYKITLSYDDAGAPDFMSHDYEVRFPAGSALESRSKGVKMYEEYRLMRQLKAALIDGNGQRFECRYHY